MVCNHVSHFDPPLLAALYPKKVDFMAMKNLFTPGFWGWLFHHLDMFPVERESVDPSAIRSALHRLKAGHIVGVFPEGGLRSKEESILNGATPAGGVAALAHMADVPIRVCLLIGGDQLYRWQNLFFRRPVYYMVGPELKADRSLPPKESRKNLAREIESIFRTMYADFQKKYHPPEYVLPHTAQERWSLGL